MKKDIFLFVLNLNKDIFAAANPYFMRFITLLLICFYTFSYSQERLTGIVFDAENNQVLEDVLVTDVKSNNWTLTNNKGYFSLRIADTENFEVNFQILGKEEKTLIPTDIENFDSIVTIRLRNEDLRLDDVTVTAVPKRSKVGSAVVLDDYAVNQRQSFSLSDILQQLPGQEIKSPDFTKANILNLRTASEEDITNAFGIAYMIDGLQISNDENMQTYNYRDGLTDFDNPSSGIDLRTIPASNIEKIEVIAGIPDAEYGNLTTGLIKIDRKAGESPYRVRASLRRGTSQVSLDKGYNLGEKAGKLSFSINYLNSNNKPLNDLDQFDRITASTIWSVASKDKKLRNSFSANFHYNFDDIDYDKENDNGSRKAKFKKDKGIRISNRLNWNLDNQFIDNIEFNAGFSYSKQHSYQQSFVNKGGEVIPEGTKTGLYEANYTPVAYLMVKEVFGAPLNFNTSLSFRKSFHTNNFSHNLSVGGNFSYSDNNGRGKGYDSGNAHSQITLKGNIGAQKAGFRPTSYRSLVIPRKNYGIYLQDNSTYTFANGNDLFANIGFRYDSQNGFSSISPRINFGYELSQKWSVRGGLGFASKAPSLSQIFPGDKYYDYLLYDIRTNNYSFNLVQTYKVAIDKLDLESSKIWKYELGTNYNSSFANFSITGYYNKTFDGIISVNQFMNLDYPEVALTYPEDNSAPNYEITGYSNRVEDYSLNKNAKEITDIGVEFFASFKKIKAINTSFSFSGRYVYTENKSIPEIISQNTNQVETEVLYGIFKSYPTKLDDFKLRGTATYHLSQLGLLISLTAEQFTRSTAYAKIKSIYPFAYINSNGDRIHIPEEDRSDERFSGLLQNPSNAKDKVTHLYHNFHLRLTKEFQNNLSLSMYVTNFLNYMPQVKTGNSRLTQNGPISFGAQINYQF